MELERIEIGCDGSESKYSHRIKKCHFSINQPLDRIFFENPFFYENGNFINILNAFFQVCK